MGVVFTNNPAKLATPPEGTKVAADEVAGEKYQIVKLDVGGLGSSVPFESTDGLPVTPLAADLVTGTRPSSDGVGDIINLDVSNYRSCSLQVSGTWVGAVIFYVSNDNVNWVVTSGNNTASTASGATTSTGSNGVFVFDLPSVKYFRARWTTATSGTVVIDAIFSQFAGARYQVLAQVGTTTPGTAAANLGKAIDSVVGATDVGVASLVKRVTTPGAITPINGDYTVLQVDSNGRLWNSGITQLIDEAGVAYGVKHIDNKPRVSSMPYLYDIAEGLVANHDHIEVIGYNADIGAAEEDVWTPGGSYVFPTGGIQMEIISSSSDDANGGTGINTVTILYLTSDFTSATETITLTGTVAAATVATNIYRVNHIFAASVGTGGKAAGNIDLRAVADTPIYAQIPVGGTMCRNAIYTVPDGKVVFITSVTASVGGAVSGRSAIITGRATYNHVTNAAVAFFIPFGEILLQDSALVRPYDIPIKFPEGTDIKIAAIADGSVKVSCSLRGWIENV